MGAQFEQEDFQLLLLATVQHAALPPLECWSPVSQNSMRRVALPDTKPQWHCSAAGRVVKHTPLSKNRETSSTGTQQQIFGNGVQGELPMQTDSSISSLFSLMCWHQWGLLLLPPDLSPSAPPTVSPAPYAIPVCWNSTSPGFCPSGPVVPLCWARLLTPAWFVFV